LENQTPADKPQEKETELVDSALSLFDLMFQYFETLGLYYQKLINQKVSTLVRFFFTSFVLLFLTLSGLSLLLYSCFHALLGVFGGNFILTSVSMGAVLTVIPIFLFLQLAKKNNL
jgi:hypothetical protein